MISTLIVGLLGAATPSPEPATIPPADITSPGIVGFIFTFGLALVCVLLFLSLTKHLRKVNRRAAQDEADEDARGAGDGPEASR